jgi:hypothetical protein
MEALKLLALRKFTIRVPSPVWTHDFGVGPFMLWGEDAGDCNMKTVQWILDLLSKLVANLECGVI